MSIVTINQPALGNNQKTQVCNVLEKYVYPTNIFSRFFFCFPSWNPFSSMMTVAIITVRDMLKITHTNAYWNGVL